MIQPSLYPSASTHVIDTHVIDRIYQSGRISRADSNHFLQALNAEQPISREELVKVRDMLDRLEMGLLRVVD